jgi:phosphoenolpyruvate carboxykinase (ATP)
MLSHQIETNETIQSHHMKGDACVREWLNNIGITQPTIIRNASPAFLYEEALKFEKGSTISSTGALMAFSGAKTGRSPQDKRITEEETTKQDIWWGSVNKPLNEHTFMINHGRAIDYLNTRERIFIFDGYAGWDPTHRVKVRVVCARGYHALFMNNMLIRPSDTELDHYGYPDLVIYNAGEFPVNRYTNGMTSTTSISLNLERKEIGE